VAGPRGSRRPHGSGGVVELYRLLIVVFFAGLGYEVARRYGSPERLLGPFNGVSIGVIIGSGLGYVLGGVLGRSTLSAVDRTTEALRDTSAEELVAGGVGLTCGVLLAGGIAWPLFFLPQPYLAFPLFLFVVAALGALGFRLGTAKRRDVLAMFGGHAGMARPVPTFSSLPRVLDTSVAVDGRILDVVRAGFLDGQMLVPTPVLAELQGLADAADPTRRSRGRRGLDVLAALRREPAVELEVLDDDVPAVPEVDAKLVRICLDRPAALVTLDTNLAKVAALAGVRVLNLHALALALRPPVVAGDDVPVALLKAGRDPGQAVGYLDDGTMVVAEGARDRIGAEVLVRVTSVLTTANGRMVFGRPVDRQGSTGPLPGPPERSGLRQRP
jgi:uncharacterized protein YacL